MISMPRDRLSSPPWGLEACEDVLGFYVSSWDLNSGLHACFLPSDLSSWSLTLFLKASLEEVPGFSFCEKSLLKLPVEIRVILVCLNQNSFKLPTGRQASQMILRACGLECVRWYGLGLLMKT